MSVWQSLLYKILFLPYLSCHFDINLQFFQSHILQHPFVHLVSVLATPDFK